METGYLGFPVPLCVGLRPQLSEEADSHLTGSGLLSCLLSLQALFILGQRPCLAEMLLTKSSVDPAAVHRLVLGPNIFIPAKTAVLFDHMHI